MSHTAALRHARAVHTLKAPSWWLGLGLSAALAVLAIAAAGLSAVQHFGVSALTLAIVLGIVAGNTFFPPVAERTASGVDFSKRTVLRIGIVLFGLRITFRDIAAVGWAGIIIDAIIVITTFVIAVQLGTRVFRLDRQTSMLIGAGSALCGAAAVMAAEPVIKGQAYKVSVAVATVVVFGTLAMFAYPLLYPSLGLSEHAYGVFTGSTVHEVAQVVAAGRGVSEAAASTAVIEKMLRVMMLAPFLMVLSGLEKHPHGTSSDGRSALRSRMVIPWFAVLFIVASLVNSAHLLPASAVAALTDLDTLLLATAMAALGLHTQVGAIHRAGMRPLLLAASLFVFLVLGGYAINRMVSHLFG
jgi:uncharacterized integral membrane protein (TIGR00698 family)